MNLRKNKSKKNITAKSIESKTAKAIVLIAVVMAMVITCCGCGAGSGANGGNNDNGGSGTNSGTNGGNKGGNGNSGNSTAFSDAALAPYEEFLEGKRNVYGDRFGIALYFVEGEDCVISTEAGSTIKEMVTKILSSYNTDFQSTLEGLRYAYIDLGCDGDPELALEISMKDSYGDSIIRGAVIKNFNGKLQLCYLTESYYRTEESLIGTNGVVVSSGSMGAMSSYYSMAVLDANGEYHFLLSQDNEFALCSYFPEANDVAKVAAKYMDKISDESLLSYTSFYDAKTGDASGHYYTADPADDELTKKIFSEAGVTNTSYEELDKITLDLLKEFKIDSIPTEAPSWKELDLKKVDLADVRDYGMNPVFVSNVDELVAAINHDTTIVLAPGEYNLTSWLKANAGKLEDYEYDHHDQTGIYNTGFGDEEPEFGVVGYYYLRLVSQDKSNPATIVSEPRYFNVMHFFDCGKVELKNLVIGHTVDPGVCSGDVVAFTDTFTSKVTGCDLYGCGAYALSLDASQSIDVNDCVIHDCTYGCVEMRASSTLFCTNTTFKDCKEYTMFNIDDSSASFTACSFSNLQGNMLNLYGNSYADFYNCMFDADALNSINAYSGPGTVNVY